MTGFGKAVWSSAGRTASVEIRSLNSKQLDLNIRIPSVYREKEAEIRSIIAQLIERGKVDLMINFENSSENNAVTINKELAKKYYKELKQLSKDIDEDGSHLLSTIIKMPDVLGQSRDQMQEGEWEEVEKAIGTACNLLNEFRLQEGHVLEQDITKRIEIILSLLKQVEPFEKERINTIRNQINESLEAAIEKQNIDRGRFEQELIYYLEKLDITEEKVRLHKHCKYFLDTMKEKSCGKKLGFITQEIGREINTLGSKANEVNMQKIVVQMKDELEKIKEQLLNIL